MLVVAVPVATLSSWSRSGVPTDASLLCLLRQGAAFMPQRLVH